jgi:Domain of unknown function (DUF4136)
MKRIATMSLTLVALVAMLGAAGLAETKSDYDHRYKLSPKSTWDFRTQKSAANDSLGNNSLWDRRVRDDLTRQFAATGLMQVSNAAPDLLISYHLGTHQGYETEYLNSGFPVYYGRFGYRRHWAGLGLGWGTTTVVRIPYMKSTLVMDVYDAHTKELVWRGYDTKTINYNKADKTINDAVGHLMKRFRHDLKVGDNEG